MDIAELGYKVDSSGLAEGTKALDENAAAAEKVSGATDRLERDFQALSRTVERSSSALGDRLGGALDRIGTGTGAVITELQALNRTNGEILASLAGLDTRFANVATQAQAFGAANASAAAATAQSATASQQLEQQLAQQEARYKAVAQQAVAWAQGSQTANVSERALAEAARDAAAGIDVKARAMSAAGTEQDRMVARARALQESESRTAAEARKAAAAAEAQEINLQQLLGQIDPTVAALNRLASMEERLERAQRAGLVNPRIFDQYQSRIDAMRASVLSASAAQNGMTLSAGQLRQSMRMLPAQITDITTSLVSGQPAWMVAIQQGGQLKDQFGGIGPAARAVGGYVLGLINPLTVTAAALAALAIAAKQSGDQLFDFQKAQILSGQEAYIGADGFLALANSIDHLQGVSRGGAIAALTETAKAGRYTGEQFEMVAAAAARMEASAGRSLSATISAFESIAKDPVEGLLKLNDAERFLTFAQLQRITALRDEGRAQEAANEAIQLYAAHLDDVANRTEALMPGMSKAWRDVKDDIGGAWSALGSFTGAVTELAGEWGILARLPRLSDMLGLGVVGSTLVKNLGLPSVTELLNRASQRMRGASAPLPPALNEDLVDPQDAQALAGRKAANDRWNRRLESYDKQLRMGAEIARIEEDGVAAGRSRAEIEATIANYMKSQEDSARRSVGVRRNSDDTAAQSLLATIQRQIQANEQLVESGDKVTASDRLVIQVQQGLADATNTMTGSQREALKAAIPLLQASDAKAKSYEKQKKAAEALARQEAILAESSRNRTRGNELDLMALGRGSDAVDMLRRQLDVQREYQDELKRIGSRDVAEDKATWDAMAANAAAHRDRELANERVFQEQRLALLGNWRAGVNRVWEDYTFAARNAMDQAGGVMNTALSGWEDAWVRLAQTGKLSFSDMANSIIADLARIGARQASMGLVNAIAGAWGGFGAGGGAGVSSTYSAQSFGNNTGWLNGGLNFGGGRANGGATNAGSFYQVGEGGRPELFEQNGRQYLIPGDSGRVIPAAPGRQATGRGEAPRVNVTINNAPAGTSAEANVSQGANGEMNIELMLKQVDQYIGGNIASGTGATYQASKSRFGLQEAV